MGYYVTYTGTVTFQRGDEDRIVEALKGLNHLHHLKGGGRFPKEGDPYADTWFAWVPRDYHEHDNLTTVEGILRLLGFEVTEDRDDDEGRTLFLDYSDKVGDEEVFLNELARWGRVFVEATGEDGARWLYESEDGRLYVAEAVVRYSDDRRDVGRYLEETARAREQFGGLRASQALEVG
jgi:hypothetical protein